MKILFVVVLKSSGAIIYETDTKANAKGYRDVLGKDKAYVSRGKDHWKNQ